MGKEVIIYDSLGLIPEPSTHSSTKAGASLEEESGSALPSQPKHPAGSRLPHPLSPMHQSINHRTKSEMKLFHRAFSKLLLKEKRKGVPTPF